MNTRSSERYIQATPDMVVSIIANIAELADWNPALLSTATDDVVARIDHPYRVVTRIPGRATLTYVEANVNRVMWRLDVAGSVETGEWDFRPDRGGTWVKHTMSHTGAVFAMLDRAMAQVPDWRLDRLQNRAERYASYGRE